MDSISFSKIRHPKVRLNPPTGSVETFPLDIAGILALVGFSERLEVPVPEVVIQLALLDSQTVMPWGDEENTALLLWLAYLVLDPVAIIEIQVELDLPDGGIFVVSRNVVHEWNALDGWFTRNA